MPLDAPARAPDVAQETLARWIPDAATLKAVLVDNAARLYDF